MWILTAFFLSINAAPESFKTPHATQEECVAEGIKSGADYYQCKVELEIQNGSDSETN